jgi:hypothetical protein
MGVLSFFVKYPSLPFHISVLYEGLYEARKAYEKTMRAREKRIPEYEIMPHSAEQIVASSAHKPCQELWDNFIQSSEIQSAVAY